MLTQQIHTQINTKEIVFQPGKPKSFEIVATNYGDRSASFWLEIIAAGVEATPNPNWYRVSPGIATFNPPGDSTKFQVTIVKSPIAGFVGQINLTVKIFSLELNTEERQVMRLMVEKDENANSLQLDLPNPRLSVPPASGIDIPLRIYNSSQKPFKVTLSLLGLNPQWFEGKTKQTFNLSPEQWLEKNFSGQLPPLTDLVAQPYPFKIVALQPNRHKISVTGNLNILTQGTVKVECDCDTAQIPKRPWLPNKSSQTTSYEVQFSNDSNLKQQVGIDFPDLAATDYQLELVTPQLELDPGEIASLTIKAQIERPWWGWRRKLNLPIVPTRSDSRIAIDQEELDLNLTVYPVVPLWLQILAVLSLLGASWLFWILVFRLAPHKERINAIAVNGMADRAVSVSNDRTIRSWRVKNFHPRSSQIVAVAPKSIRSLSLQPVNNNRVAIGLQNGEVQLWDLLSSSSEPLLSLSDNRADRVLGLEFTPDSRYLFSGHGSGTILQWNLSVESGETNSKPISSKQLSPPSAIYDLAIVGREPNTLAIAGQYNDLMLWNWQQDELSTLNYRPGGKDDYITSLATAEHQPFLLATGDSQGAISLWNLETCLTTTEPCQLLDFWQDGHAELPIRSVALSADGCYLTSSGDDGKLKLWSLTNTHQRQPQAIDGQVITQLKPKLNSVNLQQIANQLQITTGGEDGKVRIYRQKADSSCSS